MTALLFDWDEHNIAHIARHGVTPAEAEQVLLNSPVDYELQEEEGEERTLQIGMTLAGRMLALASTLRSCRIRVITAFPATPKQQLVFYKERYGNK